VRSRGSRDGEPHARNRFREDFPGALQAGILSRMGRRSTRRLQSDDFGFIFRLQFVRERIGDPSAYPYSIPAVAAADGLSLHPRVTYFVGENGSGKSTLLEAIPVAAGFNAEGGTTNFRFATRSSESKLAGALRLVRSPRRPRTGFFLRAESFFNLATTIEARDREAGLGPPTDLRSL
jgi:predicted ATPase